MGEVVTFPLHAEHFLVQLYAGPGVGGGVLLLRLAQAGCFPVGEPLSLAYLLPEDVGIELLQAHVLDAHLPCHVLQLDEGSRLEALALAQGAQVVVPGESDLGDGIVLQQVDKAVGEAYPVKAKEEADFGAAHLQQCDGMLPPLGEGRPCLRIEAQEGLLREVADGSLGVALAADDFYVSGEDCAGQAGDEALVVSVNYSLHCRLRLCHSGCGAAA